MQEINELLAGILENLDAVLTEIRGHKALLSVKEAAAYLHVSDRSIRRFIQKYPEVAIKEPGIGLRIVRASLDNIFETIFKEQEKIRIARKAHEEALIKDFLYRSRSIKENFKTGCNMSQRQMAS